MRNSEIHYFEIKSIGWNGIGNVFEYKYKNKQMKKKLRDCYIF